MSLVDDNQHFTCFAERTRMIRSWITNRRYKLWRNNLENSRKRYSQGQECFGQTYLKRRLQQKQLSKLHIHSKKHTDNSPHIWPPLSIYHPWSESSWGKLICTNQRMKRIFQVFQKTGEDPNFQVEHINSTMLGCS